MSGLAWITARPFAHRGLHDIAASIVENTASAFSAAIEAGYAMECDVQISADGEAMVHHDDALGRLTEGRGSLAEMSAAELKAVPFKVGTDRMLTLGELCDLVAGRAPLLVEIKSRFDGDLRLTRRVAAVLAAYAGPVAAMSFDPAPIEAARHIAPRLSRGMVAQRRYRHREWTALSTMEKLSLAYLLHAPRTRPQFIAYGVKDLPAPVPILARAILRLPLLTWTVRSQADQAAAAHWADQMIFEGFRPSVVEPFPAQSRIRKAQ